MQAVRGALASRRRVTPTPSATGWKPNGTKIFCSVSSPKSGVSRTESDGNARQACSMTYVRFLYHRFLARRAFISKPRVAQRTLGYDALNTTSLARRAFITLPGSRSAPRETASRALRHESRVGHARDAEGAPRSGVRCATPGGVMKALRAKSKELRAFPLPGCAARPRALR